MSTPAVVFDNVWKSYPSYHRVTGGIKSVLFHLPQVLRELKQRRSALEGISFEIKKGERFGFIGRNGAGKSTTLGLIAGVLSPDKGSVQVNGRVSPLLELGAGFHPELTGRENILLNGVLMGLTKAEVREHIDDIIEFSELGDFIEQPVRTYSSGMYAKLGFSVVSKLKPEILLLDEVLSVGDLAFQKKCETVFESFRKNKGITIIIVSHSITTVQNICDRVAWIEDKTVKMVGDAKEVVEAYIKANTVHRESPNCVLPTHVGLSATMLDCTQAPAVFSPYSSVPRSAVRLTLWERGTDIPICQWSVQAQTLALALEQDTLFLQSSHGSNIMPLEEAGCHKMRELCHKPLLLSAQCENKGILEGPKVWLPVLASENAYESWHDEHTQFLKERAGTGFPPHLWPGGKTVRVVARNIMANDAVGNFAVGMMATLTGYGIPARLYAYASCAELAGLVSSIGDLEHEIDPSDIVFYHYSTEDEFLPLVANLPCLRKILYYHNVTPAHWFSECCPELAQALERSRKQYPLFASFDAVVANSSFSLEDVLPHIHNDVPTSVFPPSMSLDRLKSLQPEPVPVPEAAHTILWVGRLVPHKRPDVALRLFESLSCLRDDTAMVMVAGGRRDFPHQFRLLGEQLSSLPEEIRARIHMVDGLRDAQLAWLYQRSSLFLCTSGHEGYCLPVYEAMSCGLPVATLPQPAVEETLTGQGTVLPHDVEQAARILHDLLTHRKSEKDKSE